MTNVQETLCLKLIFYYVFYFSFIICFFIGFQIFILACLQTWILFPPLLTFLQVILHTNKTCEKGVYYTDNIKIHRVNTMHLNK